MIHFHLNVNKRDVWPRSSLLHHQDSLEDDLSTCNESLATEPSFIDENLVFNESKRVPFFKVRGKFEAVQLLLKKLLKQRLGVRGQVFNTNAH